jgi:predicted dehydrogenase
VAKKIKVGIIGMGAIGCVHAKSYQAVDQAQLCAVCDIDAPTVARRGEEFGVEGRFTDYRKMLAGDVEAVSVCVGNALHMKVASAALKAGKHVLLEKPMAMNAAEAARILAARKRGSVLQIGMVNRQRPESQVLREYVEAGHLGKIYHMKAVQIRRRGIPGLGGWFTTKEQSGGGPLIDLGVHWFDLAMWLSGQWKPTAVSAMTYAKFGRDMKNYRYVSMWAGPPKLAGTFNVEDYSTGTVRFAGQATMAFEICWAANAKDECYVEILGDRGGARILGGDPLTIYTEHHGRLADIRPRFDDKDNRFQLQAAKFVQACLGKCPPAATGEQGLTLMRLIDGVYASSRLGREVKLRT